MTMTLFESLAAENPMPVPERPQEMIEFDYLSKMKKKEIEEKFFKNEVIQEYLDKKWAAELFNRDCFVWLWDVFHSETDPGRLHALSVKLSQFKRAIVANKNPFAALVIPWASYPFPEDVATVNWSY